MLFLSSCGPCLFCAHFVFLWALVSKNSHLFCKLICFVSVSSVLFLSSCGPWCQKTLILSWFALFLSLLCSFCLLVGLGAKKNSHLKLICLVSVSSVFFLSSCGLGANKLSSCGPWCQKNSHLKLICLFLSSVLFLSSCGPWCQKTLILSWFALFLSLLCSFCLLVGLGVKKNSHLKLICFASVSSVLFLSSCGPWCQKTLILSWFALLLSLLCSFCLLVGLGVQKLSS